ncbi:MAG: hypothetical protein HN341_13995 [Verrucomicrobia bacterium]|jgi:hypothetical protein|nr:hypothetical protein [Verrucomicrobiota bacterium]
MKQQIRLAVGAIVLAIAFGCHTKPMRENAEQKDIAKAELEKSSTLRILQVEAVTPEFEAMLQQ